MQDSSLPFPKLGPEISLHMALTFDTDSQKMHINPISNRTLFFKKYGGKKGCHFPHAFSRWVNQDISSSFYCTVKTQSKTLLELAHEMRAVPLNQGNWESLGHSSWTESLFLTPSLTVPGERLLNRSPLGGSGVLHRQSTPQSLWWGELGEGGEHPKKRTTAIFAYCLQANDCVPW